MSDVRMGDVRMGDVRMSDFEVEQVESVAAPPKARVDEAPAETPAEH